MKCPHAKIGNCNIPDGIKIIDDNAFYGCKYLTSIDIPASLESIIDSENGVFDDCESMTAINVDNENKKYYILFNRSPCFHFLRGYV